MPAISHVTRFAPSPTGALHLGNARTALFSFLAARASGGRFVLRVEDTDAERSRDAMLDRQLDELRWLGIGWDEGPDVGGPHGPYRQSQRASSYATALVRLAERGLTYPCFCTPEELQFSRKAQLASGRPPRYARTCASLGPDDIAKRLVDGKAAAVRFRVPDNRIVEFDDWIHGHQRFLTDDIGDFIVQRTDGSVAFFLGNALDDSAMGITLVLRGDDHLANTPRQLLLLEALDMRQPAYGHLPLVLSPDGSPLSKREGAASLTELRDQGYLPGALRNYLVRLGHACDREGWLTLEDAIASFDIRRTSRSAARFDDMQLRHWQREAVNHSSEDDLEHWLGSRLDVLGESPERRAFLAAVRGNLLWPHDVEALIDIVTQQEVAVADDASAEIADAGPQYFDDARRLYTDDFKSWTRALADATGRKGARLFMPLRSALTGETHGPELAPLVRLMGAERALVRLDQARRLAARH